MLAAAAVAAACGESEEERGPAERADPPAKPPAGWRTVVNRRAGFSMAVPGRWLARTRAAATLIRSPDRLVVVTVAADRSRAGRDLPLGRYARETLESLPGFEGSLTAEPRAVRAARYPARRVDGVGSVSTSRRPQRVTVVSLRRRIGATYSFVVFRNAAAPPGRGATALRGMLRTFRARPPR